MPNEPEHAAPDSACIELPAKRKNVQQQGDVHKRSTRKKCTWDVPLHVHEITDSYPNWEKRRKLDVQMRKGLWKGIPEADFALKLSSYPSQNNQTKKDLPNRQLKNWMQTEPALTTLIPPTEQELEDAGEV